MPNFDQTGPKGEGSKTGRGLGPCGCGMHFGRGCGSGCRRFILPKNKLTALEEEEKILEQELTIVREEKAVLLKKQQK